MNKGKLQEDLAKILEEALALQTEHEGKMMTKEVGAKFDALTQEGLEIQGQLDRIEKLEAMQAKAAASRPANEPARANPNVKDDDDPEPEQIAGYVTLGEYVACAPEVKTLIDAGVPKGTNANVAVEGVVYPKRGGPLVGLTEQECKDFLRRRAALIDVKAVPTLGAGIIEPQRLTGMYQVTADDRLRIRDVIPVFPTTSDTIEYQQEDSFTNSAAEVAQGSTKAESAVTYSLQTSTVRDIAHWMPVRNQQLADWGQLRGLIDGRLTYGVTRREETQLIWGDGVAPNLQGLTVAGTTDLQGVTRYSGSDPVTDHVRQAMTEVRTAGYEPTALLVHPIDWETIVLAKGSDNNYLAQVFPTADGGSRVWGLTVVESVAMAAPTGSERNWIVGDFRNGCAIFERMSVTVMVGWINAQFTSNERTILAEERIAFPIFTPAAFVYQTTAAPS
jgi:HK97 family phage major capsid protein